jgi:signal peptidase
VENTQSKKNTWKIVGNVVFWLLLVLVIFYSAVTLFSKKEHNMTSVFGTSALAVRSDSMAPTFKKGALIFIKTDFDVDELIDNFDPVEKDLVITFVESSGDEIYYNTHRVQRITEIGGVIRFYTKGDNAPDEDEMPVLSNDIIGVWTGSRLSGVGAFIEFLQSSTGFLIFIVLPCLAFLVFEIIRFTKIYSQYQVQKHVGDRVKIQEEALALARAQLEKEATETKETPEKE